MIPETLAGSYQRYKSDTNAFTTWLGKAAEACGYTIPKSAIEGSASTSVSSQSRETVSEAGKAKSLAEKLREKAAKKASKKEDKRQAEPKPSTPPSVKYTVRTQDLVRQAEIVSKNADKIKIPDNVLKIVGYAISARKRCAAWFLKTGVESDSTETHLHFINVLENVVQMLSPAAASPTEEPSEPTATKNADIASLSNRFGILSVDDPEDILDTTIITPQGKAVSHKAPKKATVYELDEQVQSARVFGVFCFFEDLHRIQEFLDETWSDYKKGTVDLMTAAMLTNTAIDMVRRAEMTIINLAFPKATAHNILSYKKLAQLIFHANSLPEDGGPLEVTKAVLRFSPFDNFIYLSTARTLFKFEAFRRGMYPHPVPPATMQYVFAQEMLGLPEVQKMDQEDRFLSQWLMDSGYRYGMETGRSDPDRMAAPYPTAFHEEITRGFMHLQQIGEVSVWMVFASRILQDVQDILGDEVHKSYEELCNTRAAVAMQLDVEEDGKFSFARGSQWKFTEENAGLLIRLHSACTWIDWIPQMKAQILKKCPIVAENSNFYHTLEELDKVFPEMAGQRALRSSKEITVAPSLELMAQTKEFKIQPIPPALSPTFLYSSNPTYSGTFAFKAICEAEEAGIALANHHQSLFFTAHLYNALKQRKLIKTDWIEMDEIIEIHKTTWFAGQMPETEATVSKRFDLCLGISIQNLARNQRNPDKEWSIRKGMEHGPQVPRNKVAAIFKPYFANEKSLEWCAFEVAKLNQQESSASTAQTLSKRTRYQPQQTPLQLLAHMKAVLPPAIKAIQPNYMPLVRVCDKLLRKCRTHVNAHLQGNPYPTIHRTGLVEVADLSLCVMVSGMLEDAKGFKMGIPRPTEIPQLEMVAPFFSKLIEERNGGAAQRSFREARQQQDVKIKEMTQAMDANFELAEYPTGDQERHEDYNMPSREFRGLDI